MELRHLNYFACVAQTLNFRQAAELLHITRPALSMQIRDLEQELGVQLLERNTAKVRLTDAGRIYLREVKRILAHVEQANEMAREAAKQEVRRIAIGGVGPLTPSFLPSVMRSFNQRFPEVEVELVDMLLDPQLRNLKNGSVQLAFEVLAETPPYADIFHYEPIRTWKLAVSLSKYHPLTDRPFLTLADLRSEVFIAFDRRVTRSHQQKIKTMFQQENLSAPRFRMAQSFDNMTSMVAADQGVSITIEVLDSHYNNGIRIVPLRFLGQTPHVILSAVWKKGNDSELVRNFVNLLKEDAGADAATAEDVEAAAALTGIRLPAAVNRQ